MDSRGVEQQTPDTGVVADGLHQVGDARRVLLFEGHGGDRRLGGAGDLVDHRIEHRRDEFVLVGERLVEVPGGDTGFPADGTHRELVGCRAEEFQAGLQEAAAPLG